MIANFIQFIFIAEKYSIIDKNIRNFDKKNFMIRVGITFI